MPLQKFFIFLLLSFPSLLPAQDKPVFKTTVSIHYKSTESKLLKDEVHDMKNLDWWPRHFIVFVENEYTENPKNDGILIGLIAKGTTDTIFDFNKLWMDSTDKKYFIKGEYELVVFSKHRRFKSFTYPLTLKPVRGNDARWISIHIGNEEFTRMFEVTSSQKLTRENKRQIEGELREFGLSGQPHTPQDPFNCKYRLVRFHSKFCEWWKGKHCILTEVY